VLALAGDVTADGVPLTPGPLLYLGTGRSALELRSAAGGRLLLLGGEPFDEQIVMWWNFVGRSHEEIVAFREEWQADVIGGGTATGRFGQVEGYDGRPLPAPSLPGVRLRPRG
jgi:quercetin 2,3-dioxygenase